MLSRYKSRSWKQSINRRWVSGSAEPSAVDCVPIWRQIQQPVGYNGTASRPTGAQTLMSLRRRLRLWYGPTACLQHDAFPSRLQSIIVSPSLGPVSTNPLYNYLTQSIPELLLPRNRILSRMINNQLKFHSFMYIYYTC